MGIALAITLLSWGLLLWGVLEVRANDWQETTGTAWKIGLTLFPAFVGPLAFLNFWWAVRIVERLRRGENVLASWRVSGGALVDFSRHDKARNALGPEFDNDWTPPDEPPPNGIEVIFGPMGVWVHDSYFTIYTSGFYKFNAVDILPDRPACIEFRTVTTTVSNISVISVRRFAAALRLPVPDPQAPEAVAVLGHYRDVLSGKTDPNQGFYQRRIRIGLIGAALFLPAAYVAYSIGPFGPDQVLARLIVMIAGTIFGLASLLLAALAWFIGRGQRR